ncbi:hypothetical protein CEUSTIGMA_g4934.t1 [Chlamydomonas eustigma]|uniref:Uncharacterized protein n=1 Tax=Chlamydomonas eustigma TaxID=1157962 RepID=A0A250X400_9CHLO|nr:hypothetical protein CEUSTIGMA_g4934.t1 [Chlamydomonas eustigma]|eukprot:GAX77490.1 hypothetical protein CEUSTIGMA_g4934.t1 [Chlamydomonas eustigma]
MEKSKEKFVSNAIKALESRPKPNFKELAGKAYESLQFDYPAVSAAEVHALAETFRGSGIKDGWFSFNLTAKLASNAVAGATQLTCSSKQLRGLPEDMTQRSSSTKNPEQESTGGLHEAYCNLCAAIFISLVRKILSLPEADSWALLEKYEPPQDPDGYFNNKSEAGAKMFRESEADQCNLSSVGNCDLDPSQQREPQQTGTQISYAAISHPKVWSKEPGGTMDHIMELLRVLGIHSHAQQLRPIMQCYVNLVADRLCEAPSGMSSCLEQLWQALGIKELPGSRRSAAMIKASPLLPEASAALSIVLQLVSTYAVDISSIHQRKGTHGGMNPGIIMGAETEGTMHQHDAMSILLPRQELWAQVHKHLLGLCARCLEDMSVLPMPGPQHVAAVSVVCQVLIFYLQQRAGTVNACQQLMKIGVLRSIAVLLPRCCSTQQHSKDDQEGRMATTSQVASSSSSCEPLRVLALLCAASSREAMSWLHAVPAVKIWIKDPDMLSGGSCEAHGGLWQILTSLTPPTSPASTLKVQHTAPVHQAAAAAAAAVAPHGILMEQLQSQDLQRLRRVLQLMSKVQQVADGGVHWGGEVMIKMRQVGEALRNRYSLVAAVASAKTEVLAPGFREAAGTSDHEGVGCSSSNGEEDLNIYGRGPSGCSAKLPVGRDDGGDDDDDDELGIERARDSNVLKARQEKQMVPDCIRLLKALMMTGSKAD